MKILFVTARIPYSGVAGGHALVYQRIMRLARRGHHIGLASLCEPGHTLNLSDPLFTAVSEYVTEATPKRAGWLRRTWRSLFSKIPAFFYDVRSPALMRQVGDIVHRSGYDLVVAEFSAMGQYLYRNPYLPAVRKIVSCHFSMATFSPDLARNLRASGTGPTSRLGMNRLLKYEINTYRNMDRVLVLTAHDRYSLLNADPTLRVNVIPVGVDTTYFRPPANEEPEKEAIIYTGQYEVYSNLDAMRWFVATCWPILKTRRPNLTFYIVGPGAETALHEIARKDPSIVVTGGVNDIRPYLRRATLFVCPVRLGSGLRFKLLEAMAAGLPLVTTTLGAEGIPLQNGDNCFMADKPEIMAECIDLLLADESLRLSIASRARTLVEERFNWDHGIDLLEDVMQDVFQH